MNDRSMQQGFMGTPCEDVMKQTVDCYNHNTELRNCDSVFDSLANCMQQNNLMSILDPQWEKNSSFFGIEPKKKTEKPSAPGARQVTV